MDLQSISHLEVRYTFKPGNTGRPQIARAGSQHRGYFRPLSLKCPLKGLFAALKLGAVLQKTRLAVEKQPQSKGCHTVPDLTVLHTEHICELKDTVTYSIPGRLVRVEARIQSHVRPCGTCGGRSGTGTGFALSSSGFPSQYHYITAPYSLVSGCTIGPLAAAVPQKKNQSTATIKILIKVCIHLGVFTIYITLLGRGY
jgi:hypothetical protein